MGDYKMDQMLDDLKISDPHPAPESHPLKLFDIAKSESRPLYVSAPMVRYSKCQAQNSIDVLADSQQLAFRQTVHHYNTDLTWTPMILSKEFNRSHLARASDLTLTPNPYEIPTIVQLGASSAQEFSRTTRLVAPYVSGVDLNCGCPQSWACAESLGAALMERRELVGEIVSTAKATLARNGMVCAKQDGHWVGKTVSVKIRIHSDLRRTIDFVNTVQAASVDFITIHGRTRRTRSSEPVNLDAIKLVAEHCTVPVIANGDVTSLTTAKHIAEQTGVQGVMSSRAILANPALYAGFETCPWECVEQFMKFGVKAPLPLKLVLHHLSEMTGDGGEGRSLLSRKERVELLECTSMLDVIDFLDDKGFVKRFD